MATIPEPKSIPCRFEEAWVGTCKAKTDNGWCTTHERLTCASCGAKAVKSCGQTSGPMCCDSPLCATCHHSNTGEGHVTKKVHDAELRAEREEKEAKERSRTSKNRRCDPAGLPLNTFELMKGNWESEGYKLIECFFVHIDHGLMGFHPAIVKTMKDASDMPLMIFTIDRSVLVEFWKLLEPKQSKIEFQLGYVNTEKKILYPYSDDLHRREILKPQRYFDKSDLETLRQDPEKNLGWAPLVIGCEMRQDSFLHMIERSEAQLV